MIVYEFPLSERIRTLLRLEDLYDKVGYFMAKDAANEHHVVLLSLFEILDVAGRGDLKSELIQELERQKQSLGALRNNPQISERALDDVLRDIEKAIADLLAISGKTGQELRDNEWLMGIKQRSAIPGGACEFDLPSYHYWLHQPAAARHRDLESWLKPFLPIRDGLKIVLRILRESGRPSRQLAAQGVYQQMMGGRLAQMLRLKIELQVDCVPEISANKYALNIRFISAAARERPRPVSMDIPFELTFCSL